MHYSGAVYHAMLRGNRKQAIFHDADDRRRFSYLVSKSLTKYSARCHAYCWMPNHVHLLLQVSDAPLSSVVHYIASCYAHDFNRKYDLVGHLFQGRYPYEHVADDGYLTSVARYIHMNPVEAGLVANPADYPWSSFLGYFGQSPDFLTTRLVLSTYGPSLDSALTAFRGLHESDGSYEPGWSRPDDENEAPQDVAEFSQNEHATLDGLIFDASQRFGYPIAEIAGPGRQRDLASARAWIGMRARLTGCASLSEVARRLNRSPQAISKLVAKVEKVEKVEKL